MKEKLFYEEYEKIEVPRGDVMKSIQMGVNSAYNEKLRKKQMRMIAISTVAAAVTFISSSFIVPTFSHVLADVPIVGGVYANFNDLVGRNLESQKLITQLNEKASSRGIDVAITSSYYDGAVIGVTFDVKGNVKVDREGNRMAVYEIFNGDERISETKELVNLQETDEGYSGHIQVSYPYSELPHETTLPLEFMSIGEKEGAWKFEVPVKQLPFELLTVNKGSISEDKSMKVQFDSIIAGNSSTAINYSYTLQGEKYDSLRLELFDDKGEGIHTVSYGKMVNPKGVDRRMTIFQGLKGKTNYVEIRPSVALFEKNQFVGLNEKTPVEISSSRQELSVKVEKMVVKDESFVIEFQVNKGEQKDRGFHFFKDFARNDVTLVQESRKDIYEEPLKHSIRVLDKDKLRFRSTFDISGIDDINEYLVRVRLNSMAMNMPVKLLPVKIDLNE
jgi:hypothetical protein